MSTFNRFIDYLQLTPEEVINHSSWDTCVIGKFSVSINTSLDEVSRELPLAFIEALSDFQSNNLYTHQDCINYLNSLLPDQLNILNDICLIG